MRKIILDVNDHLEYIENILNNYLPAIDGLLFVKNNRYPITDKENIRRSIHLGIISEKPWYPYRCIDIVTDILSRYIHEYSTSLNLFTSNPMIDSAVSKKYLDNHIFSPDEEIIHMHVNEMLTTYGYVYAYKITKEDISAITKYIRTIYEIVSLYTEPYPDNYFTFETDTSNFVLIDNGNIKTMRWDEYVEHCEIQKEMNALQ